MSPGKQWHSGQPAGVAAHWFQWKDCCSSQVDCMCQSLGSVWVAKVERSRIYLVDATWSFNVRHVSNVITQVLNVSKKCSLALGRTRCVTSILVSCRRVSSQITCVLSSFSPRWLIIDKPVSDLCTASSKSKSDNSAAYPLHRTCMSFIDHKSKCMNQILRFSVFV